MDASFPMLRKMGNKLERIEDDIFEGRRREIVRDISNVKQEIINFRKIVRPQRAVLRRPRAHQARYIAEDLDIYFDDINDASERDLAHARELQGDRRGARGHQRVGLSHRLNDVLRVLTAFSVIVLPLTLIASICGMNVKVPGEGETTAFWLIIGPDGRRRSAGMVAFFRRRGWL